MSSSDTVQPGERVSGAVAVPDEVEVVAPEDAAVEEAPPDVVARPGLVMLIVSLGIFLAALDQTVIVTALWPISVDLNVPVTELDRAAWVVTAYLLGYTVALPL
ncbi:MAG TPA: hypothetical protein VFR15_07060, partial [Chloroflexia bacterium]|nr:hypothetical protein [Chloroflexia bacterium]